MQLAGPPGGLQLCGGRTVTERLGARSGESEERQRMRGARAGGALEGGGATSYDDPVRACRCRSRHRNVRARERDESANTVVREPVTRGAYMQMYLRVRREPRARELRERDPAMDPARSSGHTHTHNHKRTRLVCRARAGRRPGRTRAACDREPERPDARRRSAGTADGPETRERERWPRPLGPPAPRPRPGLRLGRRAQAARRGAESPGPDAGRAAGCDVCMGEE